MRRPVSGHRWLLRALGENPPSLSFLPIRVIALGDLWQHWCFSKCFASFAIFLNISYFFSVLHHNPPGQFSEENCIVIENGFKEEVLNILLARMVAGHSQPLADGTPRSGAAGAGGSCAPVAAPAPLPKSLGITVTPGRPGQAFPV